MPVGFDEKDLARFPFLTEAQAKIAGSQLNHLDTFLASGIGRRIIQKATDRVEAALTIPPQGLLDHFRLSEGDISNPLESLYTYGMARIIVSCLNDRTAFERLINYEARRSSFFLMNDDSNETAPVEAARREAVAAQLGLSLSGNTVTVPAYIEMVAGLQEPLWRLVNREVYGGLVRVYPTEMEVLLRERIRVVIRARGMPRVPPEVCEHLAVSVGHLSAVLQGQMLRDLGPIDESRYPPCMNALLAALLTGRNLTHMGRFALTAFLHTIGLSTTRIVELYQRSPDFDIEKTLYQVEHISGRSGTEYTPPSCATMETNGLCAGRDGLCERINSPLGYYRKMRGKAAPEQEPGEDGV